MDRGRDTSHELTEVRIVLSRAQTALRTGLRPSYGDQPDPETEEMRAARLCAPGNGQLAQKLSGSARRRIVLEHIAASFEPGVRNPEREVARSCASGIPTTRHCHYLWTRIPVPGVGRRLAKRRHRV